MASSEETAAPAEAPTTGSKRPALDIESLQKKKFKTEDLPLSVAQHAAIENLLKAFKKKGCFDNVRKKIWAEFNESVWLLHPSPSLCLSFTFPDLRLVGLDLCLLVWAENRRRKTRSQSLSSSLQRRKLTGSLLTCHASGEKQPP